MAMWQYCIAGHRVAIIIIMSRLTVSDIIEVVRNKDKLNEIKDDDVIGASPANNHHALINNSQ